MWSAILNAEDIAVNKKSKLPAFILVREDS